MKRFLISLGAMAIAAFSLTNCTEEIENPVPEVEKVPYTIYANASAETKTINDGLSTRWAEGDALNVFHAEAGTTAYSASSTFILEDAETGKFATENLVGELAAVNDWYAVYPYYTQTESPTKTRYLAVGAEASKTQLQVGNSNMNHIAGPNYPMWGSVKGVPGAETPGIVMTHLSSLVKVVVTNGTTKDLVVATVALTAPRDISGTYYIDFTGDTPVYVSSGDIYVTNVADLTVKDGEAIPAGESAEFYLAVKPFTAYVGETLTLSVNGVQKNFTVENKDVVFAPGKIKKLKFTCEEVLEPTTIAEITAAGVGQSVLTEGLVVATYSKGFLLYDETGRIIVYEDGAPSAKVGDKVEILGTTSVYGGLVQISSPTVDVKSSGNTVTHPTPTVLDGAGLEGMLDDTEISYVKYTGTLTAGSYYNVAVEGATGVIASIQYPLASFGLKDLNGKTVTVEGYFIGVRSSGGTKYVQTMAVSVTEETVVEPEPEPVDPLAVPAVVDLTSFTPAEAPSYITTNVKDVYSTNAWKFDGTGKYAQFVVDAAVGYVNVNAYISGSSKTSALSLEGSVDGVNFVEIGSKRTTATSDTRYEFMVSDDTYRYFKIVYTKDGGNLGVKSVEFALPDNREQLATPQNVSATATGNSITVTWDNVANATSYEVTCGEETKTTAELSCIFENLNYNTPYTISVIAKGEETMYIPSAAGTAEATTGADENAVNFVLVTDASALTIGDQIVIVAAESAVALSATQNTNNRGQVDVTKDGNTVSVGADVQILTLEAGLVDGTFAFNTGSGYLYAASSSGNHLKTKAKLDNNGSWLITIDADTYVATIRAQGDNNRNVMQYNSSNKLFACYESASQKQISIYKLTN